MFHDAFRGRSTRRYTTRSSSRYAAVLWSRWNRYKIHRLVCPRLRGRRLKIRRTVKRLTGCTCTSIERGSRASPLSAAWPAFVSECSVCASSARIRVSQARSTVSDGGVSTRITRVRCCRLRATLRSVRWKRSSYTVALRTFSIFSINRDLSTKTTTC